jgi:UDP-3-O-[3-hydroxymyristoyl] glucosamine N-acyltransferase
LIHSNVSIYDHTIIGDNVIIHAGTILGADAFTTKNALMTIQLLKVVIKDNGNRLCTPCNW